MEDNVGRIGRYRCTSAFRERFDSVIEFRNGYETVSRKVTLILLFKYNNIIIKGTLTFFNHTC